jgi:hypothetical protein
MTIGANWLHAVTDSNPASARIALTPRSGLRGLGSPFGRGNVFFFPMTRSMTDVARPEGLEPPAYRFEACRSIQLSYGRTRSLSLLPTRILTRLGRPRRPPSMVFSVNCALDSVREARVFPAHGNVVGPRDSGRGF